MSQSPIRYLGLLAPVLMLAACATTKHTDTAAAPLPPLPTDQYPLTAEAQTRSVSFRINAGGLSDNQRRALDQVAEVPRLERAGLDRAQQPVAVRQGLVPVQDEELGVVAGQELAGQRLAHPGCRPLLATLVNDGSERRIDVVALAPFTGEPIEAFRQRVGAWVEVERAELGGKLGKQRRRGQPIVLPVHAVADVELVVLWR